MSMATIEIEQIEQDKWHAEVEVGGLVARRQTVRAATFEGVMAEVMRVYREILPAPLLGPNPITGTDYTRAERSAAELKRQAARDRMAKARAARGKPRGNDTLSDAG